MSHDNNEIASSEPAEVMRESIDYEELLQRLEEAEGTLEAIRSGTVDALVMSGASGNQVFTLQGAEHPYRLMVENMHEGAVSISPEFAILYSNQAFADMMGIPLSQVIGSLFREYVVPKSRKVFDYLMCLGSEENSRKLETHLEHASGRPVPVLISVSPLIENEETTALCLVVTDLSDLKAAEDVRRSNRDLEQFAYVASHDLQEPLRSISIYMQLLRRRLRDKLNAEEEELIGSAVTSAVRMGDMVNDLLAYSRVNSKGGTPLPVNSKDVVERLLADMSGTIAQVGARIEIDDSLPVVQADETQLSQVFQNLIGNALKFRGERPLEIQIGAKNDPKEWVFFVRDNGIGINPVYHDKIFTIFERLHGQDKYKGTGIGLSICKKIVERHGGRIWVESEEGQGTTFLFSLPKA